MNDCLTVKLLSKFENINNGVISLSKLLSVLTVGLKVISLSYHHVRESSEILFLRLLLMLSKVYNVGKLTHITFQ